MIKRITANMFVLREAEGGLCHQFTEEVMRLCHPVSWDLVFFDIIIREVVLGVRGQQDWSEKGCDST